MAGFVKWVICCLPELLLTARGQMTVDEAKWSTVEHEGHSHCSLVSYKTNITVSADGFLLNEPLWRVIEWLVEKWASLPRVLAIPVFTLSENTWEILFSCWGFARMMIRMFHRVWIATWMSEDDLMHQCSAAATSCRLASLSRPFTCLKLMFVIFLRTPFTVSAHSLSPKGSSWVPMT